MDHNLDHSLNLQSAMGVDFEQSEDVVVSQSDITLSDGAHEGHIPMEFENIEEQPMLMDTESEEIIVSDFIGDQFSLQDYSVQDDQTIGLTDIEQSQQQDILTSQQDPMIELQEFKPQIMTSTMQEVQDLPTIIQVKNASISNSSIKKEPVILNTLPRQIAIAPKPPKLIQVQKANLPKQFAIAPKPLPKPVALLQNRAGVMKTVTLANVQGSGKGNTVLAQIGKQLVMVPVSGSSQKVKIVTSGGNVPTVQYVRREFNESQPAIAKTQSPKPVVSKFIVKGQQNTDLTNESGVITKILPAVSAATSQTKYVTMQQKTLPIPKLWMPLNKPTVRITKQPQVTIKSPMPKLLPAPLQGATTKKIVISANAAQNVMLKAAASSKPAQIIKEGNVINVAQAQSSQLHQINVPGKGIQYIRLITNPQTTTKSTVLKPQPPLFVPSKSLVLTDKVLGKTQQKLVRIAPAITKTVQHSAAVSRSAQSLLAPILTNPMEPEVTIESGKDEMMVPAHEAEMEISETEPEPEPVDSKEALRSLIANTAPSLDVEFERLDSPLQDESSYMDQNDSKADESPLIVISSNYLKQQDSSMILPDNNDNDDSMKNNLFSVSVEAESLNSYRSKTPQAPSEQEYADPGPDLMLRPRKACNCTKSQCLKLYCDCFANGEFCNRCNCANCHNNLENEELRQKAIRGCLDRNPNAFRPKIGKAQNRQSSGPEVVRRHNKGCNCKRSGCLKNYCECYEAKIACTAICKCVGCRNVEETVERARRRDPGDRHCRRGLLLRQPCRFMTMEVIDAVCQCLVAAAGERAADPVRGVLDEFARCLHFVISAARPPPAAHDSPPPPASDSPSPPPAPASPPPAPASPPAPPPPAPAAPLVDEGCA